ncbi:YhcH/YjgK/YiaL family protein [Faecalimonas umbilicata]|uniref:Beta-D-galactosidase n=1 Tax=Faecalimonas umbilicata TaxID=1912855 RepID=A0A4R3JMY9_9FIRM|nr:YhcH/YjgK/YiaL family protein [Faecalimonas umbilicata]TCS67785.1 YhcH/YjgK/YiaL family protein [Faecalimonas umbilicata]GBU04630.1 beta-D-galactosidase [Faecalimonas umbilicata]
MLTTTMKYAEKYNYLDEKFQKAFRFLRETDLLALPVGNVLIDGEEIYANVQSYTTMTPEDCLFEAHRKYFDIQYVAEGEEVFGYEPLDSLTPAMEYDEERDLIFYEEPDQSSSIVLKAGDFAIVPPEDGHAPRRMTKNGACQVKKIVVKVKV